MNNTHYYCIYNYDNIVIIYMYIYVCMYIYVHILMVLRKAITTKITFSGLLVIQSSFKREYILILLQEYHNKMAKIGSKLIKGKGWHFSFLIKVLIVINNLVKIKVDLSDVSLHILRKCFNCFKCLNMFQVLQLSKYRHLYSLVPMIKQETASVA